MIENGQAQAAIDHCLHILKFYPRHVDTYRLLGTGYLETHRTMEASDIFQRVLSVLPDDLVAHIGRSVICEEESRLDDAIWHMQRAFEIQPANRILQSELRRLYGLRDGIEPTRVYLTRGALAHMYIKGELYPQAVAELQAALSEEPSRLDLQIVLARIYHQIGRGKEAIQTCTSILNLLPNCLDANRILLENPMDGVHEQDRTTYLNRVQALDPYYMFVTREKPASKQVSDIAVSLERLERGSATDNHKPPNSDELIPEADETIYTGSESLDSLPDWIRDLEAGSLTSSPGQSETMDLNGIVQPGINLSDGATGEPTLDSLEEVPISEEDTKPTQL